MKRGERIRAERGRKSNHEFLCVTNPNVCEYHLAPVEFVHRVHWAIWSERKGPCMDDLVNHVWRLLTRWKSSVERRLTKHFALIRLTAEERWRLAEHFKMYCWDSSFFYAETLLHHCKLNNLVQLDWQSIAFGFREIAIMTDSSFLMASTNLIQRTRVNLHICVQSCGWIYLIIFYFISCRKMYRSSQIEYLGSLSSTCNAFLAHFVFYFCSLLSILF